jgi:uncharacterized protein
VILCDTGPLIALMDRRDPNHAQCRTTFRSLTTTLLTIWPCLTEAMHFLGRSGGWPLQQGLWGMQTQQFLRIYTITHEDTLHMTELMARYRDTPMDLADASLVAVADALTLRTIFTLDSDFRIYRTHDGGAFDIVPQ